MVLGFLHIIQNVYLYLGSILSIHEVCDNCPIETETVPSFAFLLTAAACVLVISNSLTVKLNKAEAGA